MLREALDSAGVHCEVAVLAPGGSLELSGNCALDGLALEQRSRSSRRG
jgi:uncharacterized protein YpuA (DUF1002 family)